MKLRLWTNETTEYLWTEARGIEIRVDTKTGSITTIEGELPPTSVSDSIKNLYANWRSSQLAA